MHHFAAHRFMMTAAIGLTLYVSACSGDSDVTAVENSSAGPDLGINEDMRPAPDMSQENISTINETIQRAECQVITRCCTGDEQAQFGVSGGDMPCDASAGGLPPIFGLSSVQQALEEGRITLDETQAELCAESFAGLSCVEWTQRDPLESTYPGCAGVLTPQTQPGSSCRFDFECVNSSCIFDDIDSETGLCQPFLEEGDNCSNTALNCGPGLYCDTFLLEGECAQQALDGQPCLEDSNCRSENCMEDALGEKTCQPAGPLCASMVP